MHRSGPGAVGMPGGAMGDVGAKGHRGRAQVGNERGGGQDWSGAVVIGLGDEPAQANASAVSGGCAAKPLARER